MCFGILKNVTYKRANLIPMLHTLCQEEAGGLRAPKLSCPKLMLLD